MKKKNTITIAQGILIFGLAVFLTGCQEGKNEKKELTVLTEVRFQDRVQRAVTNMESLEDSLKVKVRYLPEEEKDRKIEIQKIRTQIMAGQGPDVYLLDGIQENLMEEKTPLLENPYQTMQSGALASLDTFMKTDSYWDDSTYSEIFLEAGQYHGRQYIIPLSCNYYVLERTEEAEPLDGTTLTEWLEETEHSDDVYLKEAFRRGLGGLSARWMQPAINWEKRTVYFDKEKWESFAQSYFVFKTSGENEREIQEELPYEIRQIEKGAYEAKVKLQVVPDMEGHKAAAVASFGAVGMSCDQKQKAYDFLMLFLNDRVETVKKEHPDVLRPDIGGFLDQQYMPVQETAVDQWMNGQEEKVIQKAKQSLQEIEYAFFLTSAERNLYEKMDKLIFQPLQTGEIPEGKTEGLARETEKMYKMMLME